MKLTILGGVSFYYVWHYWYSMSLDEAEKIYEEIFDYFEGRLPDPIHEPKRTLWYLKMFKYYKYRKGQKPI